MNLKWGKEEKMKLIIDEPKAVPLDESYCKRNSENSQSFIDDKFYENKQPGIFDDNFQGIEWPPKVDINPYPFGNHDTFAGFPGAFPGSGSDDK